MHHCNVYVVIVGHQASDDPSPPPAAPPSPPSPSFFSSSFFSASALSLLFAAGLASLELAGFASLLFAGFASPAEPALADAGYYADAYIAACIYASSSSIPFSKRKFAAISSFLSQAKNASAARAFEKPRPTKRSIDAISSGVT